MDQASCPAPLSALPEGYRSLLEADTLFRRALPNLIVCLEANADATEPADDRPTRSSHCPSAARYIAEGIPLYGRNVCSNIFGPILTSNMYFFTEDLTRAEHCVWPRAADGTYTDLAVRDR